ncbi:MAG: hypothetical protein KIS62_19535 [Ramlibacter sp.]|nr:hypothetical protein [Ramlibacter sp.]
MLDVLIDKALTAFERRWSYAMDYARQIWRTRRMDFVRFNLATGLGGARGDLPLAPWHLARLAAVLHEDCGPCAQLVADMALAQGVPPVVLQAALTHDLGSLARLDADAALAWDFVRAWTARRPHVEGLREQCQRRFGARGFQTLVLAAMGVRLYPQVKLALGYAQTCQRVVIGHQVIAPNPHDEHR